MKRKRIALMIFSKSMGGAESVVIEMVRHIDYKKFDVFIITNDEIQSFFFPYINKNRIFSIGRIYYLSNSVFVNKIILKIFISLNINIQKILIDQKIQKVENFIKINQIQLIHSHLELDMYMLSKVKKQLGNQIKIIFTMHGSLSLAAEDIHLCGLKKKQIIDALASYDYYTSACQFFISILKNYISIRSKYEIIENGIDFSNINCLLKKTKKTKVQHPEIVNLVYLGGERYKKGPDILLNAIDILVHKYQITHIHLDILRDISIGSPIFKLTQHRNIDQYISFNGYVPSPGHLKFVYDSDIFVLPSRTEGVANSLMEAIGLEKAIVATDVGGTGEIVIDKHNGLLSSTDPHQLAIKLKQLILNKDLRTFFSKNNKVIKSQFDWNVIIRKYEKMYKQGLNNEF